MADGLSHRPHPVPRGAPLVRARTRAKRLSKSVRRRRQRSTRSSRDAKAQRHVIRRRRRRTDHRAAHRRMALDRPRARAGFGAGAADTDPGIEPPAAARLDRRFSRVRAWPGMAQSFRSGLPGATAGEARAQARCAPVVTAGGNPPCPRGPNRADDESRVRPQAQAVFCIDVRSEPLRRNLEATGDYETFGFAGFFAVAIRHQALGSHHETDQFPVILKSKNFVREIPRTYHGHFLFKSSQSREASRSRPHAALRSQGKRLHALCHGGIARLVLQPAAGRQNSFRRPLSQASWTGSGANSFLPWRRL